MTTEKTINILGQQVRIRYCAATESGFEQLRGKSIYEIDFKSREDLIALSISGIIAAYSMTNEEPPVTSNDVMYSAKPQEILDMITAIVELRKFWYEVPEVVPHDEKPSDDEEPKN